MNRNQRRTQTKLHRPGAASGGTGARSMLATAVQQHQAGHLEQAELYYRQVLAIDPRNADAWHLLGVAAYQRGHREPAIAAFHRAIAINPTAASFHINLGIALKELGQLEEAITCYGTAIRIQPHQAEAHNYLGNALAEAGRFDAALTHYRTAIDLRRDYAEAYFNLGVTLKELGQTSQAAVCYRRAIMLRPDYHDAHYNLGNALRDLRQLAEAITSYRKAIELRPEFADAHHNVALALLAHGDLAAGWAEYEWRWQTPQMSGVHRGFTQPQWRGEIAQGRTLLIHAEQGFGDTIQFCRYAPLAAARGLRVILEVQRPLVRLLRGLPGVDRVIARGETLPSFDVHCPMLSLPRVLGTKLATIPAGIPALSADAAGIEAWRRRLAAVAAPRIGLVWAGSPTNLADCRRSLAPERLASLVALRGAWFVSLQQGGAQVPFPVFDPMANMRDFADTAALILNLDLVIAVDTAVAHLAAALGRPVWLLDRFDSCWRWLAGRRDSPWYPSLRIYRQKRPGDWEPVLQQVDRDLRFLVGAA